MKRILVVDDDYDLVMAVKRHLETTYEVDIALGGGMALRKLQKKRYDLLLLDFHMPVVSGAGVVERLRDLGIQVPVVLMSADQTILRTYVVGLKVAGRITKPFEMDALDAKLAKVLRKKKQHGWPLIEASDAALR